MTAARSSSRSTSGSPAACESSSPFSIRRELRLPSACCAQAIRECGMAAAITSWAAHLRASTRESEMARTLPRVAMTMLDLSCGLHATARWRLLMHRTILAAAGLFALAACTDSVSPPPPSLGTPRFAAAAGSGITLDQMVGELGESGYHIAKAFGPTNPHLGDAIVATFFWSGPNTITTVADHLCDNAPQPSGYPGTPVGNTYTLVESASSGGISMSTYVATHV